MRGHCHPGLDMDTFQDRISLLIPAYIRGELSDEETAQVEAAAKVDPAIARDIELQRSLRATLQSAPPPTAPSWEALKADMDAHDSRTADDKVVAFTPPPANDREGFVPRIWRVAAAGLAVIAIGQAGVMGYMATHDEAPRYVTASSISESAAFKVGFGVGVSEADLRNMLLDAELRIVDGPSAIGLYTVAPAGDADCTEASETLARTPGVDTVSKCS